MSFSGKHFTSDLSCKEKLGLFFSCLVAGAVAVGGGFGANELLEASKYELKSSVLDVDLKPYSSTMMLPDVKLVHNNKEFGIPSLTVNNCKMCTNNSGKIFAVAETYFKNAKSQDSIPAYFVKNMGGVSQSYVMDKTNLIFGTGIPFDEDAIIIPSSKKLNFDNTKLILEGKNLEPILNSKYKNVWSLVKGIK